VASSPEASILSLQLRAWRNKMLLEKLKNSLFMQRLFFNLDLFSKQKSRQPPSEHSFKVVKCDWRANG
jgi:hypothetical protein